ncbi:MAG: hypothetical protein D4R45_04745, partial [Planctomycetaceae bacterium]
DHFLVTQTDHSLEGRAGNFPGNRTNPSPADSEQEVNSQQAVEDNFLMIQIAHLPLDSEEEEDFLAIRIGHSMAVLGQEVVFQEAPAVCLEEAEI